MRYDLSGDELEFEILGIKELEEANKKALEVLESYNQDGAFYGHGFYDALKKLKGSQGILKIEK